MSLLGISAQVFHEVSLGIIVGPEYFTPPPKVDSRVVILKRRAEPLIDASDQVEFFRLVKAGFSERRKKLRSSLAGGLQLDKSATDELLRMADLSPEARAQELSIQDWRRLLLALRSR
jgi:16S rRNA (adenine1518-N6/adenine1519-N6)-dimethyltransferase